MVTALSPQSGRNAASLPTTCAANRVNVPDVSCSRFGVGIALVIMLLWDRQFDLSRMKEYRPSKKASGLLIAAFVIAFIIIGLDIVSVVLECGPGICPDSPPTNYPFSPF